MQNQISNGNTILYTNNTEAIILAGDVVPFAGNICIALGDIAIGGQGTLVNRGEFQLPADSATAFEQGDRLYWNVAGKKLTKTDTDVPAGMCSEAKAAAGTYGFVIIHM